MPHSTRDAHCVPHGLDANVCGKGSVFATSAAARGIAKDMWIIVDANQLNQIQPTLSTGVLRPATSSPCKAVKRTVSHAFASRTRGLRAFDVDGQRRPGGMTHATDRKHSPMKTANISTARAATADAGRIRIGGAAARCRCLRSRPWTSAGSRWAAPCAAPKAL